MPQEKKNVVVKVFHPETGKTTRQKLPDPKETISGGFAFGGATFEPPEMPLSTEQPRKIQDLPKAS